MNHSTYKILEFDTILEELSNNAISNKVKEKIRALMPYSTIGDVKRHTKETTEAKLILETMGTPPLAQMTNMDDIMTLSEIHTMLVPEQLNDIRQFIVACNRMKSYLNRAASTHANIASYGYSINDLSHLREEIFKCIRGNEVDDHASPALSTIRKKKIRLEDRIREKLNGLLRGNSKYFSENFITLRHGHYTLPVKKEYKNQIKGSVIDSSNSGGTFFIEPHTVSKMQDDLSMLTIEEDNEVRRILYTLTALVEDYIPTIKINLDAMEIMDFLFAKAKLSLDMEANEADMIKERRILIKSGRHPLLDKETAVPLDFYMGENLQPNYHIRNVVITGPNTGGKTVSIKTVGLLNLMAQCGLHVPAKEAIFCMQKRILCDIGDGQSITENLSTFSSHITNIIDILEKADEDSLVLLDELGSGTDPTEGMGLATAILEDIASKKSLLIATTHYPEIKDFAVKKEGFINARMAFDRENLKPLYRLELGEAGESCALYIAKRLGLPIKLIDRAHEVAYKSTTVATTPIIHDKKDIISVDENIDAILNRHHRINSVKQTAENTANIPKSSFSIGDSVFVMPDKTVGIIYAIEDSKGMVGVQIKKEKHLINHKRVKLHIPASELYPPDYDFSIIFDSIDTRKARHKMTKGHCPDLEITIKE